MAVKTITIDLEAYGILARHKRKGQSFSQVIKERLGSKTGRDLEAVLDEVALADETLANIEGRIKARRREAAKAPRL